MEKGRNSCVRVASAQVSAIPFLLLYYANEALQPCLPWLISGSDSCPLYTVIKSIPSMREAHWARQDVIRRVRLRVAPYHLFTWPSRWFVYSPKGFPHLWAMCERERWVDLVLPVVPMD